MASWGGIKSAGAGAAIVVTSVVVGTAVIQPRLTNDGSGGGEAQAANAWINTTGQTCTYSASPITFTEAEANGWLCDSFDEAYDEISAETGASCGGEIRIRPGSYPSETVTGFRDNCPTDASGMTLFAPEGYDCDLEEIPDGDTDVIITDGSIQPGDAENSGPSAAIGHVTFCGLTMEVAGTTNTNSSGSATDNSRYGIFVRGSRHVTYKRSVFGGLAIFKTGYDAYNDTTGWINFLFNDIGPCHEYSNECNNGKVDIVENTLIEGNYFHDFRSLSNCTTGGAVDCGHWETLFLNGTKDVTIRRNRFFNYEQSGAIYTTCSGSDIAAIAGMCHQNLLIENNWFESPSNTNQGGQDPGDGGERGEAVLGPGHCEGHGSPDMDNVIIRNNTVVGALGELQLSTGNQPSPCAIGSGGFQITGNIANRITAPTYGCSQTNVTINYNIGTIYSSNGSNACGANAHNSTLATSIMNNSTWASLSQDMHLQSGSTVAAGFVPEAWCPDEDYDGDARPAGACDAGADER